MNHDENKINLESLIRKIREVVTARIMIINPLEVQCLMEHVGEIEPFYNVTYVNASSYPEHPSWENLRFLELFPNIRNLRVYDRKICSQSEAKRMTFDGIQNCPNLEFFHSSCLMLPPILSGIEFCTKLRVFSSNTVYNGDRPMDITPLSELPYLEKIQMCVGYGTELIEVETQGLDLSRCKSLESLAVCPTSKDFRFLGSVQLNILLTPFSGIESLDGLDTARLIHLDLQHNQITCVEKLRGAKLGGHRDCLEGNPIESDVLKDIISSWISE